MSARTSDETQVTSTTEPRSLTSPTVAEPNENKSARTVSSVTSVTPKVDSPPCAEADRLVAALLEQIGRAQRLANEFRIRAEVELSHGDKERYRLRHESYASAGQVARTYTRLLDSISLAAGAIRRLRGGPDQTIRIERLEIARGGQAVVVAQTRRKGGAG